MNNDANLEIKQSQQQFAVGKDRMPLTVTSYYDEEGVCLIFSMPEKKKCILHWGMLKENGGNWIAAPKDVWAEGSEKFDDLSVRTPFRSEGGASVIKFKLLKPLEWRAIEFVLFYPEEDRYEKNGRYNYSLSLTYTEKSGVLPEVALKEWVGEENIDDSVMCKNYHLENGDDLALCRVQVEGGFDVYMVSNVPSPLFLHWGVTDKYNLGWTCPPVSLRNKISVVYDDKSVRTAFTSEDGLSKLKIEIPGSLASGPEAITFLLYQSSEDQWIKYKGNDIFLPLFIDDNAPDAVPQEFVEMIEAIIGCEAGHNSWTLMHRYNLCIDLLGRNIINEYSLMITFVWLRYSATRQLDWQRNYNTKPRELADSQKKLTYRLAALWKEYPEQRYWIRRIMHTVGRGGDGGQGQLIRDEILNIMHRNHIKETHGHFMEEWHQKLHNNTTPDDVVICKAYLAYLRSDGNLETFNHVLNENGVTRERMRNYDRPIVTDPDFRGDIKGALIHDFENYLVILETVHGGAELNAALKRAGHRLSGDLKDSIYALLSDEHKRIERTISAREKLADYINSAGDDTEILDLVYLDLSLEDIVRRDFENIPQTDYNWLIAVLHQALAQMGLSGKSSQELVLAKTHWDRLISNGVDISGIQALEGVTVAERFARVVQDGAAHVSGLIQPIADYIGKACRCDEWAVKLFAEETVRGGESYPLSKVVHEMLKHLRSAAGMRGWQVIGPGSASGKLVEVNNLHEVEAEVYAEPTILVTEIAGGDEDVPSGVVGLLTRVAPDLVSHLSVRARNLGVVFGACFEDEVWNEVRALIGKSIIISSTPTGSILYKEGKNDSIKSFDKKFDVSKVKVRDFSNWAVSRDNFTREILGGKSNNLNLLLGKLPEWMKLPMSMAVPFGSFEKALESKENQEFTTGYSSLVALAEENANTNLAKLRKLILQLNEPEGFKDEFLKVWDQCNFDDTGWNEVWLAVKKVWASKWNNRAFYSRKHLGLEHDKLQMGVLVQQVVRADYAFVIHTVNPISGNSDEVFAEVVLGLGETLVGNYPGRSLGFTYNKNSENIEIFSLPGKSEGLFGGGVIFRSDSNGEDLEGFAGAGLYDSYLAHEPQARVIDYTNEKILLDSGFREELCKQIGRIGVEVEKVCGSAQDIEGAVQDGEYYIVQNRPQIGL